MPPSPALAGIVSWLSLMRVPAGSLPQPNVSSKRSEMTPRGQVLAPVGAVAVRFLRHPPVEGSDSEPCDEN